ncbi:MAG: 30S ribosomal protein S6 [Deltaproteobacteria bacterium RIFOXYC2_FULL_48_10]|nr:MAG: 30S ribosomal protein S6 [Deltaproteobacteria bacterium RIFOXYC2_FULL_48_10]OGR33499.1 MAG: 30S ribosomal protein S6 [Desulfobacula sp. RIFOXYB2_FULL_45_6]
MRKYETVFISDPDLQDQTRTDLFDKVRNIIAKENGYLIDFDDWGSKKLSYEIKKKLRGHYVCVTYGGSGELVKELERNLRLSDDVMKFMTILLLEHVTLEQLEKEAEEAKNKPQKSDETDETSDKEGVVEEDASEEDDDDTETDEEPE